ncbi:MAG: TIGR03087 family PEP-CTERM/XrtA system glycosyltransferase [Pseudomonadota bacterium]
MASLLVLPHRMPYPPDKGDKVRSHHLLRHLARRHRVFVGTFVDDLADEAHLPALRAACAGLHAERLRPAAARVASLGALAAGGPLTMHYYRSAALADWVARTVCEQQIDAALVFSSAMAQYLEPHPGLPMLVDFVDVDSAKWAAYAPRHRWPLGWLYRREGRTLLAAERRIAQRARMSFFATAKEAELFRGLAPESRERVDSFDNGVDAEHFDPALAFASPFGDEPPPLVFTGAMDYWPNVDAVAWFAREVLPALRRRRPQLRLWIVGRPPAPAVRELAADPGAGVVVTGTVPDVRPYLRHAGVVVAPLRLARGIQNKILEAMAMARPVVAAASCVEAMHALDGRDLLAAAEPQQYLQAMERLLDHPAEAATLGAAARRCVREHYSWDAHLARLDRHLAGLAHGAPPAAGMPAGAAPSAAPAPAGPAAAALTGGAMR